jgi:transcriptional regulator with XRE-family HTH domain
MAAAGSKKDSTNIPSTIKGKVAARLKAVRIGRGYSSYEKFTIEKNLNRSQYGSYERGANITLVNLEKILRALDISWSEFFSEGFD